MSIEAKIDQLIEAMSKLTAALSNSNHAGQPTNLIGVSTAKTLAQSITEGPSESEAEAPAEVVTIVKAKTTKPKAIAETAPAICKADVQSAVTEGVGKVGRQAVLDLLQKYGATNVTTLAESLYGKFMTDIAAMLQKAAA